QLMRDWTSPVYAFFNPQPVILEINGRWAHDFKCCACGCKVKVCQYLDKKDAWSTGNMWKHVKKCWGVKALASADACKDVKEALKVITKSILQDGSIMSMIKKEGKLTYSVWPHTCTELRGFQSLMKTGCLELYIPSHFTVSHNVCLVFACTCNQVAKKLREYDGKLNFTTDGWTSPNHQAFIAFCVHLQETGKLLVMPLDIIELVMVISTYLMVGGHITD
ncbi:hypothetical protein EDC04DRAFT_2587236, partial [Pisolithus marmoratus]